MTSSIAGFSGELSFLLIIRKSPRNFFFSLIIFKIVWTMMKVYPKNKESLFVKVQKEMLKDFEILDALI